MILLGLLIIPTIVAVAAFIFGKNEVTWKEFLIQLVAQSALIGIAMALIYHNKTADVEIWTGRVNNKAREIVSCEHSYTCNCTTSCTGGKDSTCTTTCQTCYEHSYDVDWAVYTTNQERIEIDRVSRQGLTQPPRWTAVQMGEPTAVAHSYVNYIKVSPDSLFRHQGLVTKYEKSLPSYPGEIFDYYRINRLKTVGLSLTDANEWNRKLEELNADIGRLKQANLAVIVVKDMSDDYFDAMEEKWLGGKKNDVILVIGTDGTEIKSARVMAWTDSQMFKVQTRDQILDIKTLDREKILKVLDENTRSLYIRKHMSDFEYLNKSVTPSTGEMMFLFILGLAMSIGISYYVLNNNIYEGSRRYGYRRF